MSKKIQMLIGTILGNCLVLALYNLWPDIPADVVQWAITGISGAGLGGVIGQGFADGMSRGLSSSHGKRIIDAKILEDEAKAGE